MNPIVEVLQNSHEVFDGFMEVYLFGSALSSESPNDIDLVLVYRIKDEESATGRKAELTERLGQVFPDLPIDLTILSEEELAGTRFLDAVCSRRIVVGIQEEQVECITRATAQAPQNPALE